MNGRYGRNGRYHKVRKMISVMMIVILLSCNLNSFVKAEDNEHVFEGDTLNGWQVDIQWSNGTRDLAVHSAKSETIDAKLVINYYAPLSAMTKTYQPGTVKFSIPDIGGVKRSGTAFSAITAVGSENSSWNCTYDVQSQSYVFTNKYAFEEGKPLSGGFEMMWKLSSRDCTNGYALDFNPVFTLDQDSTRMSQMHFSFNTVRDYYTINLSSDYLTYNEYLDTNINKDGYITYKYTTNFVRITNARAADLNTYFVKFSFENPVSDSDMASIIVQSTKDGQNVESNLERIEDPYTGETVWGFYRFENLESANLGSDTFRLSYPNSLVDKNVKVAGFLKVHYLDEKNDVWYTYENQQQGENLSAEIENGITLYKFKYGNGNFSMGKGSPYESANLNNPATNEGSAPADSRKLLAKKIYNNETVTFVVSGNYRLTTSMAPRGMKSRLNEGSGDIDNGSGDINLDTRFDMILGDDRLTALLNGNTFRMLESDEYTIKRLVYPSDSYGYDYDVYISTVGYSISTDAVANSNDYIPFGTGNTRTQSVFDFSDVDGGVKAVYVKIKNIKNNNYSTKYNLSIAFNIDQQSELAKDERDRINTTDGRLTNIGFMRALKAGTDTDVFTVGNDSFVGTFTDKFKQLDRQGYGKLLYHSMSSVYLRDIITSITSATRMTSVARSSQEGGGYSISIDSTGTIKADDGTPGSLEKFSLYVKIPELLDIDSYLENITLKDCSAVDTLGHFIGTQIFIDNVSYRLITLDSGEKVVAADFDFSSNPLEISSLTTINLNVPAILSYTNYKTASQKNYRTDTYVMIRDQGISRIVATAQYATTDNYDLNGNNRTNEVVAGSYHSVSYQTVVDEWTNTAEKFVKSYRDDTWQYTYDSTLKKFVSSTTVNAKGQSFTVEANRRAQYSYRISLDIGSSTKDIYFEDVLETAQDSDVDAEKRWKGTLQSIDLSYAVGLGLIPTVYYSYEEGASYSESGNAESYTNNLSDFTIAQNSQWEGNVWNAPEGVRSFVVHFDASGLQGASIQKKQLYCVVNMIAPEVTSVTNKNLLGGYAVNDYNVYYTSSTRVKLTSEKAKVKLLPPVVLLTLLKVDGETGTPLRDARFSFYKNEDCTDPAKDWEGNITAQNVAVNRLGELIVDTLEPGTYWYKEVSAPPGYLLNETKPAGGWPSVTLSNADMGYNDETHKNLTYTENEFVIKNERLTGTLVFTKTDADDASIEGLSGAVYELYDSSGTKILTDEENVYQKTGGTKTEFVTDSSGKITISGLPWGNYYLTEVTAPDGYELNVDRVWVNIDKNVNLEEQPVKKAIVVYPKQADDEKTAAIRLTKYDEDGVTGLANAWFALEEKNGSEWNTVDGYEYLKTSLSGMITIEDLKFGTYRFKEIIAPTGYVLDHSDLYTSEIELNVSTADTMQRVTKKNKRIKGSATLYKSSDDGIPLNGSVFNLYKVEGEIDPAGMIMENGTVKDSSYGGASLGDPEDIPIKLQMATKTVNGQAGMLETVTNLEWGKYYFKEFYAPSGYDMDNKIYYFEVTAENAAVVNDNIKPVNQRKKGEVILNKTAAKPVTVGTTTYHAGDAIPGAVFSLFTADSQPVYVKAGTKVVEGVTVDCFTVCESTDSGASLLMTTNASGKIRIDGIEWGGYYLEEVQAPAGFAIADKIRFTVNAASCLSVQELECEDEEMKCLIRIDKEIDAKYKEFGTPSFTFKITKTDDLANPVDYTRMIVLSGDSLSGSTTVQVPVGNYMVEEVSVGRYELTKTEYVTANTTATNLQIDGMIQNEKDGGKVFTFSLSADGGVPQTAELKFTNTLKNYNRISHTNTLANIIASERKVTGFSLELKDQYIDCANTETNTYNVTHDMVLGFLTYDDGEVVEMTTDQLNAITPNVWEIDNGYLKAGQSHVLSAAYTDPDTHKIYRTNFLITVGPYSTVESQKVVFMSDRENQSVFIKDGRQLSVNTVYYNDNETGTAKTAFSGSYTEPTIVTADSILRHWEIVGANIDGLVGTSLSPTESAVTKLLKEKYDDGLRELELRAVIDGMVVDYDCTGQVEKFVAPKDGIYYLEGWGAQGGGAKGADIYPETDPSKWYDVEGGRGGYSYGYVYLHEGDEVYVAVGGKGNTFYHEYNGVDNSESGSKAGGYNGGGEAKTVDYGGSWYNGSGGGATHFAINQNLGELSAYKDAQNDVLLVAGGGGGSSFYQNLQNSNSGFWHHGNGGFGGGETGGSNYHNNSGAGTPKIKEATGGTQSSGGSGKNNSNTTVTSGIFGKSQTDNSIVWATGGGGGWYGGGSSSLQGGGGGSGHVNEDSLITGATIGGNESFISPNGEMETGHAGNGHARITYISDGQFNLQYSQTVNRFTAPFTGYYKLEGWGAAGGGSKRINSANPTKTANDASHTEEAFKNLDMYEVEGGRGGYSGGYVYLTAGQSIYYAVGGKGEMYYQGLNSTLYDSSGNVVEGQSVQIWSANLNRYVERKKAGGGFNGGGEIITSDGNGYRYSGSGGGATHFALTPVENGLLADYKNNRDKVLLVAGGGGASGTYLNLHSIYCYYGRGGSGGGTESQGNYDLFTQISGYQSKVNGSTENGVGRRIDNNDDTKLGSFGKGALSGGGAGFYGGNTIGSMGGAGGSGYVNTDYLLNTLNINGVFEDKVYKNRSYIVESGSYTTSDGTVVNETEIPTHPGAIVDNGIVGVDTQDETMIGNRGNGFARITYIPYTESIDYTCVKKVQTFTAPVDGIYKLEAWGASGGTAYQPENLSNYAEGGKGGYSYGSVYLNGGQTIYLAVGGAGENTTKRDTEVSGGFNGGGKGKTGGDSSSVFTGGGGATHFALELTNNGLLADYSNNQNAILLVAGAGGGGSIKFHTYEQNTGGYGGGVNGGDGQGDTPTGVGRGGTQMKGGVTGNATHYLQNGSFGKGGTNSINDYRGTGGGSGWYGGSYGHLNGGSGGGGSGHCNESELLTSYGYDTIGGNMTFKSPDGTNETGHTGDGYARVTYVGAPEPHDFAYTGSVQTFTADKEGRYIFEAWGASGGNGMGGNTQNDGTVHENMGRGGYTSGSINLTKGETIYIYVGGRGQDGVCKKAVTGGWNGGGGSDHDHSDDESGAGGGGATDFRLVPSTESDGFSGFPSLKSRIMVAAGGGGGDYFNAYGGAGGGLEGLKGYIGTIGGGTAPTVYSNSMPGTQTSGYQFGIGQTYIQQTSNYVVGGGGGGYYGATAVEGRSGNCVDSGGAGGSSYISGYGECNAVAEDLVNGNISHTGSPNHYSGKVFTNGVMIDGASSMTDPDGSTVTGHSNDGYARITYIG